jgi:hypothetical protein
MAKCGYCGSFIIIGGVRARDHSARYCNAKCYQNANILRLTTNVAPEVLEREVERLWSGVCPECRGPGPVDVHKIHEVWSALVITRWSTKAQVSCHSCAIKRQLRGTVLSFFLGWWGIPWGIILTPVQISRNIVGAIRGPNAARASEGLRKTMLVTIGAQIIAGEKAAKTRLLAPKAAEPTGKGQSPADPIPNLNRR